MAATVTISRVSPRGGEVRSYGTLNVGVYATGGIAVTPNKFKLGDGGFDLFLYNTTTGHQCGFDKTNKKIKVYTQGVTTGATGAAAVGNGAFPIDDAGAELTARLATSAASTTYKMGPLLEVTNAVDLTTITFAFEAVGQY